MFRPSPTPGLPGWETLTNHTDDNGDSDSEDDELQPTAAVRPALGHRPPPKRKETDPDVEPVTKRPRHEQRMGDGSLKGKSMLVAGSSRVDALASGSSTSTTPSRQVVEGGRVARIAKQLDEMASSPPNPITASSSAPARPGNSIASLRNKYTTSTNAESKSSSRPSTSTSSATVSTSVSNRSSSSMLPPPLPSRARAAEFDAITNGTSPPTRSQPTISTSSQPINKPTAPPPKPPSPVVWPKPRSAKPLLLKTKLLYTPTKPSLTQTKLSYKPPSRSNEDIPSSLDSNLFSRALLLKPRTPSRPGRTSLPSSDDVIEISSGDDESADPSPRRPTAIKKKVDPKIRLASDPSKAVPTASSSSSLQDLSKRKLVDNSRPSLTSKKPEVIEIVSSDEEPPQKKITTLDASVNKPVNEGVASLNSDQATTSLPDSVDMMDVDPILTRKTVSHSKTPDSKIDQAMDAQSSNSPKSLTSAPLPPNNTTPQQDKGKGRQEPTSPAPNTPCPRPMQTSPGSPNVVQKPINRQGFNPITTPPASSPKQRIQTAVTPTSTSGPCSNSKSSEESRKLSIPRQVSDGDVEIDMRSLNAALVIEAPSVQAKVHSLLQTVKKQPISPRISRTANFKNIARKSVRGRPPRTVLDGIHSIAERHRAREEVQKQGHSLGTAIDLTSDGDDMDEVMDTIPPRLSSEEPLPPLPTSSASPSPPPSATKSPQTMATTSTTPVSAIRPLDPRRNSVPSFDSIHKTSGTPPISSSTATSSTGTRNLSLPTRPQVSAAKAASMPLLPVASDSAQKLQTTSIRPQAPRDSPGAALTPAVQAPSSAFGPRPFSELRDVEEVQALMEEDTDSSMDDRHSEIASDGMELDEIFETNATTATIAGASEDQVNSQQSTATIKTLDRVARLRQREMSGSSSEAGPSRSSPSASNSIRRSSRLSSYSSASEDGLVNLFEEEKESTSEIVPASRSTTPEEEGMVAPKSRILGGFPTLSWAEFRQNPENFNLKVYHNKDLPHSLQDHMNRLSVRARGMLGNRQVFEAMILENTQEDEPHAPPIQICNDFDDEATPLWEFHYSNQMWHGDGVPDPDLKNLLSCDCRGACNPKSKTCACVKRQREAMINEPAGAEFIYDKNGRLKVPCYPIYECNDLCGCSEECRNRVVQQGRKVQVTISKTKHKGWGVFNGSKKIYKGTFIGIYSGELLSEAEAHNRGVNYDKIGKTYLFDLDFWHMGQHYKALNKARRKAENEGLKATDEGPKDTDKPADDDSEDDDFENLYTVDAYHAGNFSRFLNHSCLPNCRLYPCYINEANIDKPLLVIFSTRDIEPFKEICFNYMGNYPEDGEPELPKEDHRKDYMRCMCEAPKCTGYMFK